ncbi:hypothetical protein AAMO2058_001000300 [Amorphochlora amoebiformis]
MFNQKPGETAVGVKILKNKVSALAIKAKENRRFSAAAGTFQLAHTRKQKQEDLLGGLQVPYIDGRLKLWSLLDFQHNDAVELWGAGANADNAASGEEEGMSRSESTMENGDMHEKSNVQRRFPSYKGKKGFKSPKRGKGELKSQQILKHAFGYTTADSVKKAVKYVNHHRKNQKSATQSAVASMKKFLKIRQMGARNNEVQNVRYWKFKNGPPREVNISKEIKLSLKRARKHLDQSHRKLRERKRREIYRKKMRRKSSEIGVDTGYLEDDTRYRKPRSMSHTSSSYVSFQFENRSDSITGSVITGQNTHRSDATNPRNEIDIGRTQTNDLNSSNPIVAPLVGFDEVSRGGRGTRHARERKPARQKKSKKDFLNAVPFADHKVQRQWLEVARLRRHLVSQRPEQKSYFETHMLSDTTITLTQTLMWLLYCKYFQKNSNQIQEELSNDARRLTRYLVKQLRPATVPAAKVVKRGHIMSRSMVAADTFHHYYPAIAADTIFTIWRELFPASFGLLDGSLLLQLHADIYEYHNGHKPSVALHKHVRTVLFDPVEDPKADEEEEFQPQSTKVPKTPLEMRRKALRQAVKERARRVHDSKRNRFDLAGLSPSVQQSLGPSGRTPLLSLGNGEGARGLQLTTSPHDLPAGAEEAANPESGFVEHVAVSYSRPGIIQKERLENLDEWFKEYSRMYADTQLAVAASRQGLKGFKTTPRGPITLSSLLRKSMRRKLTAKTIPSKEYLMQILMHDMAERKLDWVPEESVRRNEEILTLHDDPDVDILDVLSAKPKPKKKYKDDPFLNGLLDSGETTPQSHSDTPRTELSDGPTVRTEALSENEAQLAFERPSLDMTSLIEPVQVPEWPPN